MKFTANPLVFGLCATALVGLLQSPSQSFAQNSDRLRKEVKLKSHHLDYPIDLSKILKQPKTAVPDPSKLPVQAKRQKTLEVIGTLITKDQQLAWVKVDHQVYLLEKGQAIPRTDARVSQIKPQSVVITLLQGCKNSPRCELTINIRDTLF